MGNEFIDIEALMDQDAGVRATARVAVDYYREMQVAHEDRREPYGPASRAAAGRGAMAALDAFAAMIKTAVDTTDEEAWVNAKGYLIEKCGTTESPKGLDDWFNETGWEAQL